MHARDAVGGCHEGGPNAVPPIEVAAHHRGVACEHELGRSALGVGRLDYALAWALEHAVEETVEAAPAA